ncbi:pentapeptide repeat-containing protein [Pseudoponticoccus marisrubri]|uniref:Pentapeptide repeat-containing protein n=1 Tax=Pseudoponticoccus marisrubri TaxID=1685382 RepID=A0A0W7WLQ0_9RHOB|nr:pentapeptide repeat-containing protein [Pseudoponticoccus marisrubri]KUF11487.1 hypothetical protein AVJ23_06905 [Pseudoponticoccus marisrubri]
MSEMLWNGAAFLMVLAALAGAVVLLLAGVRTARGQPPEGLDKLRRSMGLPGMPSAVLLIGGLLWSGIMLVLFFGLVGLIFDVLWQAMPTPDPSPVSRWLSGVTGSASDGVWTFRIRLAQIAALTTVLGAVIALPITLTRLRLARESLFNTKISEAAADLHAMRQVTKTARGDSRKNRKTYENIWEDDIIRRIAAIDRLEGLVEENPKEATRVARLLSVYVRELSRQFPPKPVPDTNDVKVIKMWAQRLEPVRTDMQAAVQTLGRLPKIKSVTLEPGTVDLQGANLQGLVLSNANFDGATLGEAQLQGASLFGAQLQGAVLLEAQLQGAVLVEAQLQGARLMRAQLQGAVLVEAQLQGAVLVEAQLQGAVLVGAQLQGADLRGAQLQGASLFGAQFDVSTDLTRATLRGARVRSVDFTSLPDFEGHVPEMFGDGTVTLPANCTRPSHWTEEVLDPAEFYTRWRAWQRSSGMDPDNPE